MAALLQGSGPWALWHPTILAGTVLAALWYLRWGRRAHRRSRTFVAPGKIACGLLGLVTVYLAVGSPLSDLAQRSLFSACMLQQVLLAFVAAPLLLCGLPGGLLQPVVRRTGWIRGIRLATAPVTASLLFQLLFGAFFIPTVFDAVISHRALYLAAAAVLTIAAACMWWPVASPLPDLPALSDPAQLVYLLANWLAILVAFVVVLFGAGLPYAVYASAPLPLGFSATLDRQLAGVVLGVLSHVAYGVAIAAAFFRWATAESHTATPARIYRSLLAAGFTESQASHIAGMRVDGRP